MEFIQELQWNDKIILYQTQVLFFFFQNRWKQLPWHAGERSPTDAKGGKSDTETFAKKKRDPKTKTRATIERHSSSSILLWECLRAPESRPIIPWFHSSYSQSGSFSYTFKLGKKKNLPDHCSSCSTDTNNSLPLKIESRLIWTRLLRSCHRWCHVLF